MSTSAPLAYTPSKSSSSNSTTISSYSRTASQSVFGSEGQGQRRSGSSGSAGSGSAHRGASTSARNHQALRKQHKNQKKPRFADEDAMAESAAMKSTSSRKGRTSITHLMNFTLPPRPQYQPLHTYGRSNPRRQSMWGLGSGRHAVDKARYVHANYRFIVDPKGDYRAQAADADVPLDWTSVHQILASSQTQCSACPICLSTPTAPRMARCGHIFCLPCLIRYMHSTDDVAPLPEKKARWKKCPICWDTVYMSDTRPVRWFVGQEGLPPREGDDVVLRLIKRQPWSTMALPKDGADELLDSEDIPWHFAAEVADYARVMKATEDYMNTQFDEEIEQLRNQSHEDELIYGDEPEWAKKAISVIKDAKEKLKAMGSPPHQVLAPGKAQSMRRPPIKFSEPEEGVPDMYLLRQAVVSGQSSSGGTSTPTSQQQTPPAEEVIGSQATSLSSGTDSQRPLHDDHVSRPIQHDSSGSLLPVPTALPHRAHAVAGGPSNHNTPYYFYQALLHYYLSPLDIRILKAAFGDFSSFPSTILPRVEHVSTGNVVDDELRKRAKYLGHLPYGCEVGFLECNWTGVLPPEILSRFKTDIERRRKKNQDKEMKEEKDRVRAEKAEEDQQWRPTRRKRSELTRSSISEDDVAGDADGLPSVDISGSSASPPWFSSSRQQQGSAFASLASPSTSPAAPRTVWGTSAVLSSSPPKRPSHPEADMPENDGWLQGWEQDLLHTDELVTQIQATSLGGSSPMSVAHTGGNGAGGGNGGKKKKGKKITLMSTNVRRGA